MELEVSNASPREGENVEFTCNPTSTESDLTYSWYVDDSIIPGESAATYTLAGGSRADSDKYYACKVTTTANSLVDTSPERTVTFLCKYP